jgi:hypothetical protein
VGKVVEALRNGATDGSTVVAAAGALVPPSTTGSMAAGMATTKARVTAVTVRRISDRDALEEAPLFVLIAPPSVVIAWRQSERFCQRCQRNLAMSPTFLRPGVAEDHQPTWDEADRHSSPMPSLKHQGNHRDGVRHNFPFIRWQRILVNSLAG